MRIDTNSYNDIIKEDDYNKNYKEYINKTINETEKQIIIEQEELDSYDNYEKYSKMVDIIYNDKEEKIKHDSHWCNDCNTDDIIEDLSHGILICKNCGSVVSNMLDTNAEWYQFGDNEKKEIGRSSLVINRLLPQSSIATTISGNCSSRIKTLHGWSAMPYKERSLNEVFKIIQMKCNEGKIMKCIEDDAKIMYKNISDCKHTIGKNKNKNIIIRGINRKSLIAACILYACKKKNKIRSPKEIGKLFQLKYTEITKGCKTFLKMAKMKHLDIKYTFTKPEHFITRFCDELKIKKEYTEQAIQISRNVQKLHIASVHTPLSLATGSIYLMIHINGFDIQKKKIAKKFNVSQVTIAKAFKKLVPFIKILINDNISNQINEEILKYQDNIKISNEIKPKFIRFGVNVYSKNLDENPFSVYDEKNNFLNIDLIHEHSNEFRIKNMQIETTHLIQQLKFTEDIHKILNS